MHLTTLPPTPGYTGKRSGENRVDRIGKLVPVDTVMWFYVHVDMGD